MTIGLIGLGRMGQAIAHRLLKAGFSVIGFDLKQNIKNLNNKKKFTQVQTLEQVAQQARIIWLMVPAGKTVDTAIKNLLPYLQEKDIIIDGGNSYFHDSIKHYNFLKEKKINFLDCGTSGGLHGKQKGFSLMIGGDESVFTHCLDIFKALAQCNGFAYMGPTGSGHYVKMVHNGIEYALLQAYAEGFSLLKNGHYKQLNLETITKTWSHGAIIRSWILTLAHTVFKKDQELLHISGEIGENLTGQWTAQEAQKFSIPVDLIQKSLDIRAWSRETGGNYATKVVALLRKQFGGHPIKKKD